MLRPLIILFVKEQMNDDSEIKKSCIIIEKFSIIL